MTVCAYLSLHDIQSYNQFDLKQPIRPGSLTLRVKVNYLVKAANPARIVVFKVKVNYLVKAANPARMGYFSTNSVTI